MVCNRCKTVVHDILENMGLSVRKIDLGEIEIAEQLSSDQMKGLNEKLKLSGFEIIDDQKSKLIENIRKLLLELSQPKSNRGNRKISVLLEEQVKRDYKYLSNLFSGVEGQTIEHYFINLKIEKVKELLTYDEMSLNDIADEMNYSSVSHLSKQFKVITGFTPSEFKKLKTKKDEKNNSNYCDGIRMYFKCTNCNRKIRHNKCKLFIRVWSRSKRYSFAISFRCISINSFTWYFSF